MERANAATLVLGLSSGTSMDGIDAALVGIDEAAGSLDLIAFRTFPYDAELQGALRAAAASGAVELALLGVVVGEAFAAAALALLDEAGVAVAEVECIGSHGQTLVHVPEPIGCGGTFARATLQIGEPAVIAERAGITTVAAFRNRDMAAGGQGAPLVPILDHRLYTHPELGRVALNIGGIANVTGLPPGAALEAVRAFDTGPGNVLLDAAARRRGLPGGRDGDGARARRGAVDEGLLETLLAHPFLARRPPKSADLADFLGDYAEGLWEASEAHTDADLLATLTELTARTVADGIEAFLAVRQPVDEVVVSGGGAHNLALMERLRAHLGDSRLAAAGEITAIPGDAKEAVAFALIAHETLAGRPGNVPAATGAAGPRVLGVVVPAGEGKG